jgi:hypothetical protein
LEFTIRGQLLALFKSTDFMTGTRPTTIQLSSFMQHLQGRFGAGSACRRHLLRVQQQITGVCISLVSSWGRDSSSSNSRTIREHQIAAAKCRCHGCLPGAAWRPIPWECHRSSEPPRSGSSSEDRVRPASLGDGPGTSGTPETARILVGSPLRAASRRSVAPLYRVKMPHPMLIVRGLSVASLGRSGNGNGRMSKNPSGLVGPPS